ncbi:transient receptor potential channel pyrexia isoform X2 [Daphnia magna]|uniref:transient receptor potential channel pyrexia isoform X2 n=1 Tax=Daphnia magna TaxID=35525 RepID=UPI001E1BA083|nr:transient receptor potential channel pyrexia isoform X2 [Daphnia magna]
MSDQLTNKKIVEQDDSDDDTDGKENGLSTKSLTAKQIAYQRQQPGRPKLVTQGALNSESQMSVLKKKGASGNATKQSLKNIPMKSDWSQTAFNRSESFAVRDLVDEVSPTAGCVWPQSVLALAIDELLIPKDPAIVRSAKIVLRDSKDASVWKKMPQECRNIGVLYAALKGREAMLKFFLELGGEAKSTDLMRRSALHYAASWPGAEAAVCIDLLVKHGAVVNVWDVNDEATPLCCAAASGCIESVESLLKAGADVNAKVSTSPLVLAVRSRSLACATRLIAAGAAVNSVQVNSESPLHVAAVQGDADCLKLLLENKADTRAVCDGRMKALHLAAFNGKVACIRLLLQASKMEIDTQEADGRTPLHLAALCQSVESVAVLLENGARHDVFDHMKETPLHSAAVKCRRSIDVVKLLISNGANVNAQNQCGQTPLHFAAINENSKLAAFLIKSGTDLSIKNREGNTALELVARRVPNALQAIQRKLDSAVEIASHDPTDLDCELRLDLRVLVPRGNQQHAGEMAMLKSLIAADQRHFLQHPVIGAFLHLKWMKIRAVFILSLLFQSCYVLSLSLNIHSMYVNNASVTNCSLNSNSSLCEPKNQLHANTLWYLTVIWGSATGCKELFQLHCNPTEYARDPENYAQLFSIVGMVLTLLRSNLKEAGEDHSDWQHHLAAVVIIVSWCNLMMHVGRFPVIVLMNLLVGLAVSDIQGLQNSAGLDRLVRLTKQIARMEIFVFFPWFIHFHSKRAKFSKRECLQRKVLVVSPKAKRTYNFKPNDPRDHCFPPDIKEGLLAIAINKMVNTKTNNLQNVTSTGTPIKRPLDPISEDHLKEVLNRVDDLFQNYMSQIIVMNTALKKELTGLEDTVTSTEDWQRTPYCHRSMTEENISSFELV